MSPLKISAITLVELIIAITLLSFIALSFGAIDLFSRFQVQSTDRRAALQNETSLALDQMNKAIGAAIGNELVEGVDSVINVQAISGNPSIKAFVDNGDGQRSAALDRWIAYQLIGNELQFCSACGDSSCNACAADSWGAAHKETLTKRITAMTVTKPVIALPDSTSRLSENWVGIELDACWNPIPAVGDPACGSQENPAVNMRTRIILPAVAVN